MNVLIACEESQRVCTAFRAKGHTAYSCDIESAGGAALLAHKKRCSPLARREVRI